MKNLDDRIKDLTAAVKGLGKQVVRLAKSVDMLSKSHESVILQSEIEEYKQDILVLQRELDEANRLERSHLIMRDNDRLNDVVKKFRKILKEYDDV